MTKNSPKKNAPKGYNEINNFITSISQEISLGNLGELEVKERIDTFLENCYQKRLSVSTSLLQLLSKFQHHQTKAHLIILLLSHCRPHKVLKVMMEFIRAQDTPDRLRSKLIPVLEKYNASNQIQELVTCYQDKEYLASEALASLLACIKPSGEETKNFFPYIANQSVEFYRMLALDLADRAEEQRIWLLGSLLEYPDDQVAKTAIMALGEAGSSLAYELLNNASLSSAKIKNWQHKVLEQLEKKQKPTSRQFIVHKCYLSWIDEGGSRLVLISQRSGRGRLSVATFMLNEQEGIQDCSLWPSISGFEMESMIKSLEVEMGLRQFDQDMAIQVLEDGLWRIHQNKKILPPAFLSVRNIFGTQKLTPKAYIANIDHAYLEAVLKNIKDLCANSSCLLKHPPFSQWHVDIPEAYEFVKERRSLLNGCKIRKGTLTQFIKVLMESEREKWQRRFLLMADFFYQISPRRYREQIDICLAISISIRNKTPLASIPFMLELAEISIDQIRNKVINSYL